MGEIGRSVATKFNISVQRGRKKPGGQHGTSCNSDAQLQTCKQKAQGGEGTPTKDGISILRTGLFQLRTVLIQACVKISVAGSKMSWKLHSTSPPAQAEALVYNPTPGHRGWDRSGSRKTVRVS